MISKCDPERESESAFAESGPSVPQKFDTSVVNEGTSTTMNENVVTNEEISIASYERSPLEPPVCVVTPLRQDSENISLDEVLDPSISLDEINEYLREQFDMDSFDAIELNPEDLN